MIDLKDQGQNPATNLSLFETAPLRSPAGAPPPTREPHDPLILAGTSSFTADGWQGTFYPANLKSSDYLRHYATRFPTVEIDSTFYGTPKPERVRVWYDRTPPDFVFAAKVPQIITHD